MAINSSRDFYSRIEQFYTGSGEREANMEMQLQELRRLHDNTTRHGKVTQVDPEKQMARIEMGSGSGGESFLSPWVPFNSKAGPGGKMQRWEPPFKDQQMTITSPTGEWRQGTLDAMTWSDENKAPSKSNDEHVQGWGDYKRTEAKDFSKHQVGEDAWHTAQKDHVSIVFGKDGDNVVWVDKEGIWSTKPIQQKKYPHKDKSPAGDGSGGGSGGSGGGGGGGGGGS